MAIQEAPVIGIAAMAEAFFNGVRKAQENNRRNEWTGTEALRTIAAFYDVFDQTHPLAVYARVGPLPGMEKDKVAYTVLHMRVFFNAEDLPAKPGRVIEETRHKWGNTHPISLHLSMDPSYIPEAILEERENDLALKDYKKVYPLEGVTKEDILEIAGEFSSV